MIDVRLQLLIAVAEYGTVTAAAEALYRSPSGVSKQLRELSAALDIVLLERQGRRVELTAAGLRLVEHARRMNAQWEQALSDTAAAAARVSGPVRIGGFPTAMSSVIAPAIGAIRARNPALIPTAHEVYSNEIQRSLVTGVVDVGIYVAGEEDAGTERELLHVTGLLDDPIDLLVPANHPFAGQGGVALEDAADEDWISGRQNQDSQIELLAATRASGYSPRVVHYSQELTAVTALVAHGLGIAAVPRMATVVPHLQVVRVPLLGENIPHRRILVCARRGSQDNPRISTAIAGLHEAAAHLKDRQRPQ